jgi:hypothetical protein
LNYSFRDESAWTTLRGSRPARRSQSGVPTRRGVEDEEADLVVENVDCVLEADARSLPPLISPPLFELSCREESR